MTRTSQGVLVIGAGIAGLMAARRLRAAGREVLVLDKGRGVGGRMATRRIGEAVFDHGAQFFTVREEAFRRVVEEASRAGAVAPWWSEGGEVRYRAVPGMTALPKWMARDLNLRLGTWVTALREREGWEAVLENGEAVPAGAVILTAPRPQAMELLGHRSGSASSDYEPCLSLLALPLHPPRLPPPGALALEAGPITWIADNRRKGVSPRAEAVTIHGSASFSRERFEDPEAARLLWEAAGAWLEGPLPLHELHRWRYSRAVGTHPERYLRLADGLLLAGDCFGGARVEGAALSGLAAAEALL